MAVQGSGGRREILKSVKDGESEVTNWYEVKREMASTNLELERKYDVTLSGA